MEEQFLCPIMLEVMQDPVLDPTDGHSYERSAIVQHLRGNATSPQTRRPLTAAQLLPNRTLRAAIEQWKQDCAAGTGELRLGDLEVDEAAPPLGRGSFKVTFRASAFLGPRRLRTPCAAARMQLDGADGALREAAVLRGLAGHPHLVRYFGFCKSESALWLLFELAPLGSLDAFMEEHEEAMTRAVCDIITAQVADGMAALAHAKVVHCDLAARNILVFAHAPGDATVTLVKIADFGLALDYQYKTHATHTSIQLPTRWLAPESHQRRRFNEKTDVWAFGVTCFEIYSAGALPYWEVVDDTTLIRGVCDGSLRLARPEACAEEQWKVIVSCMALDPRARPQFTQLKAALIRRGDADGDAGIGPNVGPDHEDVRRPAASTDATVGKVYPWMTMK